MNFECFVLAQNLKSRNLNIPCVFFHRAACSSFDKKYSVSLSSIRDTLFCTPAVNVSLSWYSELMSVQFVALTVLFVSPLQHSDAGVCQGAKFLLIKQSPWSREGEGPDLTATWSTQVP